MQMAYKERCMLHVVYSGLYTLRTADQQQLQETRLALESTLYDKCNLNRSAMDPRVQEHLWLAIVSYSYR